MFCFYPQPSGEAGRTVCPECGRTSADALRARRGTNAVWLATAASLATFTTVVLLMWYRYVILNDSFRQWQIAFDDSVRMTIIGAVTGIIGINRWPLRNSVLIVTACIVLARVVFVGLVHLLVQIPLIQIVAYYPATLGCVIVSIGVGVTAIMASTKTIAKAASRGV